MEPEAHLRALRRDAAALLDAARATGPEATVDACPGWSVDDLVWHIGEVHHFWGTIVRDRLPHLDRYTPPERPADHDETLAFADASRDMLVEALSSTVPTTEVWTWSDQHDVAFVTRRMAQETAVHRWDAETAAGRRSTIDAELAADGIDEFLVHFLPNVADDAPPLDGSVHLHCTDVAGEWLVVVHPSSGKYVVTREHAKGSAAMRASAETLLLALWRRHRLDTVDVVGDHEVAQRFVARTGLE